MFDEAIELKVPQHASSDHPKVPSKRIGVLLANLGTPDNYDYWSMRRYLSEFLSDRRVIDYSPWLWQPLLQLVILSFFSVSMNRIKASSIDLVGASSFDNAVRFS